MEQIVTVAFSLVAPNRAEAERTLRRHLSVVVPDVAIALWWWLVQNTVPDENHSVPESG